MLENVTHYCREDHCSLTSDALQLFTLSSKWITLFYQPWKCTLNRSLLSLNQLLYWLPASCCLTVIILTPRAASKGAVRGIKPFQKNILMRPPPLKWYELERHIIVTLTKNPPCCSAWTWTWTCSLLFTDMSPISKWKTRCWFSEPGWLTIVHGGVSKCISVMTLVLKTLRQVKTSLHPRRSLFIHPTMSLSVM